MQSEISLSMYFRGDEVKVTLQLDTERLTKDTHIHAHRNKDSRQPSSYHSVLSMNFQNSL